MPTLENLSRVLPKDQVIDLAALGVALDALVSKAIQSGDVHLELDDAPREIIGYVITTPVDPKVAPTVVALYGEPIPEPVSEQPLPLESETP